MKGLVLRIENLYSELEMNLTQQQVVDFEDILQKIEELMIMLEGLKIGDCWCQVGIGNPMMTKHSEICLKLQKTFNNL